MSAIDHIKQVRNALGIGLTEAKTLIEEFETPEKAIEAWHQQQEEKRLEEEAREFVDPKHWTNHFYWKYGPPIEPKDLDHLKMLTTNHCQLLWSEFVTERSDHLMREDAEKQGEIRHAERVDGYNWEDNSFSDDTNLKRLGEVLTPLLNWSDNDELYLFFGKNSGFKLNWGLFLKFRKPLLYQTYATVLVNPNAPEIVIFEEHGYIRIGERI